MNECPYCHQTVDTNRSGWFREVEGWEQVRKGGGANKIALRRTTGRVAHQTCLGMQTNQGRMF